VRHCCTDVAHFLRISIMSIMFLVFPSLDRHVHFLQSFCWKTAMLTYKSLNIGQPEHLSVLLSDCTPSRQLRSSDHQLLSQPTDNTVFTGRAFSSTTPRIWNSLPITIRTAFTTNTFRRHLKTHLFSDNTAID